MLGIAEIEGDPFKVEEATRKLEREVGPLELEIQERSKRRNGPVVAPIVGGSSIANNASGSGRSGLSSVLFGRSMNTAAAAVGQSISTTTDEQNLFGKLRQSYIPPTTTLFPDLEYGNNTSYEEDSLTTPLTSTTHQQSIQNSEHLLRESQALCADTEQIGLVTLETMGRQREQLERSTYLLEEAMGNTEQARRILKDM